MTFDLLGVKQHHFITFSQDVVTLVKHLDCDCRGRHHKVQSDRADTIKTSTQSRKTPEQSKTHPEINILSIIDHRPVKVSSDRCGSRTTEAALLVFFKCLSLLGLFSSTSGSSPLPVLVSEPEQLDPALSVSPLSRQVRLSVDWRKIQNTRRRLQTKHSVTLWWNIKLFNSYFHK